MTTYFRVYAHYNNTTSIDGCWVRKDSMRAYKKAQKKELRKVFGVKGRITFITTQKVEVANGFEGVAITFEGKGYKVYA